MDHEGEVVHLKFEEDGDGEFQAHLVPCCFTMQTKRP
jgi:hypothetical protein